MSEDDGMSKRWFRHRGLKAATLLVLLVSSVPMLPNLASAAPGDISTFAGNGSASSTGDGGPATSASLNSPVGVALDSAGNVYISEFSGMRIRKISPTGVIATVAGNGSAGFSGDNGPATSARLDHPQALAVDRAGNLYVADDFNNRVRRVDAVTGIIATVAGTGPVGEGAGGFSGDNGPATSARLSGPSGVVIDAANNLYIADHYNNRVRKVDPTGIITTVAGNGTAGFSGDNGPATSAQLHIPHQLAVDAMGNLYIADALNYRVRKVDSLGTITTVAGSGTAAFSGDGGPATNASITSPNGVRVDAIGNLYISDRDNYRLRKVDPTGIITTVAGTGVPGFSGDGGPATSAQFSNIGGLTDIAVDPAGGIFIGDYGNHRVRKIEAPQQYAVVVNPPAQSRSVGETASLTARVTNPTGTAVGGATVNFTRTGANAAPTQSIVTNASGNAAYSYVGTRQGADAIAVTVAGSPTGTASATVSWGAAPGYPSGDCTGLGTNVFDGFVDDDYVRLRTTPNPQDPTETWVCIALDDGATHFGGKVRVSGATPGVVVIDDNQGSCDANPLSRILNEDGSVGPLTFEVDVNALPGSDVAWVCVDVNGVLAKRVFITTAVTPGSGFHQDLAVPFPYLEQPNLGSASSVCQASGIGRTRLLNADVGTAHVWLDTLSENGGTRSTACLRAQNPSVSPTTSAGARLNVDGGGSQTLVTTDTTFDFTPCDTNVLSLSTPPVQVKAHAGVPAWTCVQVGGIVRRVKVDGGDQTFVTFAQDSS